MAELQSIIVFHGRHFVRCLGICNPICVKLLQIMSDVIPCNTKQKRRLYLKQFSWGPQTRHTHTQTDRHTHTRTTIAQGEMQCVAFHLKMKTLSIALIQQEDQNTPFKCQRWIMQLRQEWNSGSLNFDLKMYFKVHRQHISTVQWFDSNKPLADL